VKAHAAQVPLSPSGIDLHEYDPGRHDGLSKVAAVERTRPLLAELAELQEQLYGADQHAVLIVLQGLDGSGKDGAIRSALTSFSPQGVRVESFKVPTDEELAHDFLWRVHRVTPRHGIIGVFNRSHYESVLVERVDELVPPSVWRQRYDQINAFEELLVAERTIVLKFFLHIGKDEQIERFRDREREPSKAWKLSADDWRKHHQWDAYMAAYGDALGKCSTEHAPWYVVPSNHKWFRDLAICQTLVTALRPYAAQWQQTLRDLSARRLAELAAVRDAT
jgi:PPK2 family polyphosphate:nucleotide phosphotransferase